MIHEITTRYALLLECISTLESLEKEGGDFEIFYRNQSFLKRQFDLELNRKKTAFKFAPIEQRDCMIKYKKQLQILIRQYFFYHNEDEEVQRISNENQDILNVATYTVKRIFKAQLMPLLIKHHDKLEGGVTDTQVIHLYGTHHITESTVEIAGYGNFYLDYVGVIYPNGEAEFKGNNLAGSTYISWYIRSWNQYPGLFEMSRDGNEWRIDANMKIGGELPYNLQGFSIVLSNCNSEKFYQNAAWLEKKYGEFKIKFAAVYT
jgi:hypothetical protein